MKKELFEKWLSKQGVGSYRNYVSRINSLEASVGDMDDHYNNDRCASLLEMFTYTKDDMKNKIVPKHSLLSKATEGKNQFQSYFEGTNDFKSRITRYVAFRDNLKKLPLYIELRNATELVPDEHDGSYELVREAVKAFSTVPEEQLDYTDLDAMWFMCVSTLRHGFQVKKSLISKSHLPEDEKERLKNLLDSIWKKAENNEYTNPQKNELSVGMFGTGFRTFRGSVTQGTARLFVRMCIEILNIDDDNDLFDKAENVLKTGLKGIGPASASQFLHCLKPYTFPIINGKQGEGTLLYDYLGIHIDSPVTANLYIMNARRILKYRDDNFSFKNFRIMDLVRVGDDITHAGDSNVNLCWYVGASYGGNDDQTERFIDEGIWQNGYDIKYTDLVKQIQVGDKIAIKSTYTQKHNLPFDCNGNVVSVMAIKAIGTVTKNHGDGKTLDVDWTKLAEFKKWYFFTGRITVWKVETHEDDWMSKALLDFTFNNKTQNIERFLSHPYWAEKYGIEEISGIDINEEEKVNNSVKRTPRTDMTHPLNQIIYGAPGTGKTYASAEYALAIIEHRKINHDQVTSRERMALMEKYESYVENGQITFTTFHQSYGYEEFIQGIRPDATSGTVSFKVVDGIFKKVVDRALRDNDNNYVIIIDEINRANISKVFGELITLIEEDKRCGELNQLTTTLPLGGKFTVPNNLYIIGTMNTADKSISLIDAALRRRFSFIEMAPDESLIENATLRKVLSTLNTYLRKELRSTDLLIGHSYFIGKTSDTLCNIMNQNIVPLLYEYFYDDEAKVKKSLECLAKTDCEIDDTSQCRIRVRKKA